MGFGGYGDKGVLGSRTVNETINRKVNETVERKVVEKHDEDQGDPGDEHRD